MTVEIMWYIRCDYMCQSEVLDLRGHILVVLFQFIDLCKLLGCDYCDSIRGIGPKRAYDLLFYFSL